MEDFFKIQYWKTIPKLFFIDIRQKLRYTGIAKNKLQEQVAKNKLQKQTHKLGERNAESGCFTIERILTLTT